MNKSKFPINILCFICGKKIVANNGDQLRRKYCSNKCRNRNNNYNRKRLGVYCIDCGVAVNINSNRCTKCYFKYRDMSNNKNPNYKNGKSAGYILRLATESIINSGREIIICERCGNKNGNNVIHHKDRNRKNNFNKNLEVLCSSCHIKEHRSNDRKIKQCKFCKNSYLGLKNQKFCSGLCCSREYRKKNRITLNKLYREWWKNKNVEKTSGVEDEKV